MTEAEDTQAQNEVIVMTSLSDVIKQTNNKI